MQGSSAQSRRRWLRAMLLMLLSAPAAASAWSFGVEPRHLRARRVSLSKAPATRFAFFTDVHFKGSPALLEACLGTIRRWNPEFAVFAGDLVEDAEFLEGALQRIGRIGVPLFGVPGNHDYWSGVDFGHIADVFRQTGGAWLLDERAGAADGRVLISGHTCRGEPLPPERGRRNIALIHYPVWADRLPAGYDAVLAGHSHGGQVRLPFLGALVKPSGVGRYERGRFETPAGPLYVSAGVGTFHMNARFCCPPEVLLVEL